MVREGTGSKNAVAVLKALGSSSAAPGAAEQLFVKNLSGRSVSVHVDLNKDVVELLEAVADREGLALAGEARASLRFVFGGRQLEPGLPLRVYGVSKGSNVHLTSVLRSHLRTQWVKLRVSITTPFAEVGGMLEVPERRWESFTLCPRVLRSLHRVSDFLGGTARELADGHRRVLLGEDSPMRLHLNSPMIFQCLRPHGMVDIWHRLQSLPARIELRGSLTMVLASRDDRLQLGLMDRESIGGLQVNVSLMSESERIVDDVTEKFQDLRAAMVPDEVCCICLEPMQFGEMLRRLPCLHRLHAGCAMAVLPAARSCPLCRCSIAADLGGSAGPPAAMEASESEDDGNSNEEEDDFLAETEDVEDASMEDVESSSDNEAGAIDVE